MISDSCTCTSGQRQIWEALKNTPMIFAGVDRMLRYEWILNPHPDFGDFAVLGKRDDELGSGPSIEELVALKRRVLERGLKERRVITFTRSDESRVYDITATPVLDEQGQVRSVITAALDITDQKQHEQLLGEANRRLELDLADMLRLQESSKRLILPNSPDELYGEIVEAAVSIMRSKAGTIQVFCPELGKLRLLASVGIEPEAESYWEWVSAEAGTSCAEALRTASRVVVPDIETCHFMAGTSDLEAVCKSGIRAVQSTPLISRTGDLLGMITTHWTKPHLPPERNLRMLDLLARQAADLIERSHAEESLRQLNGALEERVAKRTGELKDLSDRLRLLASELTETEQRARRRIAALLHDHLQQLLVAAKMRVSGLRGMTAERSAAAPVIRAEELISEAIEASRSLTAELRPPALYESGLVPALRWLSEQTEERHRLKVHIDANCPVEPPVGQVGTLLFECVKELLLNVIKYAGVDEAFVHLEEGANEVLCITVRDEGAGFDPAELEGHQTDGGFGLFSIRERLQVLGGKMEIESAPGEGTRVRLLAPLARREQEGPALKERPQSGPGEGASEDLAGEPPAGAEVIRVLLADDHDMVRSGVAALLENAPEIEVIAEVGDGKEAVDAASKLRPDVALLDVNMPNMNGIEAAVLIRKETPGVQVIGLSVHADRQTRQTMLDAGAAGYLPKDSPADDLIAAVRNASKIIRGNSLDLKSATSVQHPP